MPSSVKGSYPTKFRCDECLSHFDSHLSFSKHYINQHGSEDEYIPNISEMNKEQKDNLRARNIGNYSIITVSPGYVENKLDNCKSKKIILGPTKEAEQLLEAEGIDPKKAEKEILHKCGLPVCNSCEAHRKFKVFDRYIPFLSTFQNPKLITFETVNKDLPMTKENKKEYERKFRNFLRNLERALQENPKQFIQESFLEKHRGQKRKDVLEKYQNYEIKYLRAMEIKKTDNGNYWHYHAVMDLPYIDKEKLTEFWKKQTGASIKMNSVRHYNSQAQAKTEETGLFKDLQDKYPDVSRNILRALWYITKYITKMDWLTTDEYCRFGYGTCFVQKSHTVTKVRVNGTSRQKMTVEVHLSEHYTEKIEVEFKGIEEIEGDPPPKPKKFVSISDFD